MPAIVDCGHGGTSTSPSSCPDAELEAVAPSGQFGEILDRIAEHVRDHRTTLVFVNTRKLAERVAHQLAERLDDGSEGPGRPARWLPRITGACPRSADASSRRGCAPGRCARWWRRRRSSSGIDVGPVELVCQIGSPRSIGTFLQRVGRANHQLEGTPAGRLYPLTRDELVECTALLARGPGRARWTSSGRPSARSTCWPSRSSPRSPAAEEWDEDGLFELVRGAAPYAELTAEAFD